MTGGGSNAINSYRLNFKVDSSTGQNLSIPSQSWVMQLVTHINTQPTSSWGSQITFK